MTIPNDHGITEGHLAECEEEIRMMGRTMDTLYSQLALKERELQRLLVVQTELVQQVQIADASAEVFENTIRYAQEMFKRLPFDFGSNSFFETCDQIEHEVASQVTENLRLENLVALREAAASV